MLNIRTLLTVTITLLSWTISSTTSNKTGKFYEMPLADEFRSVTNYHGEVVYMTDALATKLEQEANTWHWTPWLPTRTVKFENYVVEVQCLYGDSIDSFPDGIFTEDQLRQGAFLLYALFGAYAFTLLAVICNDYFIPSVEFICEDLKIPPNVGAATFMAAATSCPEFFVNVISTFITESDMGIGTIVGSALFNALGVAAIGGLAAVRPIHIEWQPVTRDVLVYMVNVSALVVIVWDGVIAWYEAMVLGILYVLYFFVIFNSPRIFSLIRMLIQKCRKKSISDTEDPDIPTIDKQIKNECPVDDTISRISSISVKTKLSDDGEPEKFTDIFVFPKDKSMALRVWWLYTLPLRTILAFTIPPPKIYRKVYPFSFIMCIVWIGINSYFVSWSMTVVGHTFLIPDSIMGMTFLAFGGCLPEACSIYIMSRRGEGGMGVSNALGANSLAILFALGIPWLIRTLTQLGRGLPALVHINSSGIDFVVGSLLVAVLCLWITLYLGKFVLRKRLGFILSLFYLTFITFAILVEMGVILERMVRLC